jgi:hypothetical protein
MKMAETAVESRKDSGKLEHNVREDSEYVRLVISDEPRVGDFDISQVQSRARIKAFIRWIKALIWCLVIATLILVFLKWGVSFLFDKVLPHFSPLLLFLPLCLPCIGAFSAPLINNYCINRILLLFVFGLICSRWFFFGIKLDS